MQVAQTIKGSEYVARSQVPPEMISGKHARRQAKVHFFAVCISLRKPRGWSGGAMVLGKLSVPGRPAGFDWSRARSYYSCSRCGWGCLDIFSLVYHFSFFFLPLSWRRPGID